MNLPEYELIWFGRALLAAALGFVIGWERENAGAAAGDRTFALVASAAAVLTAFSLNTFPSSADRVIAGIVTGIGFLGAGMIMRRPSGEAYGLTTAAGLWAVTAVGVMAGSGHYWLSVLLTILVLVLLQWENIPFVRRLGLVNSRSPSTDARNRSLDSDGPGAAQSR